VALEQAQGDRLSGSSSDGTALARAIGARERDPALRCPDRLAREFIDDRRIAKLSDRPRGQRLARWLTERRVPGAYWFEIARVKHFDALLLEEVAKGVDQVVILGAGLDSRPYRFSAELARVEVFEVDHPATAARKQERVAAVLGSPPENITYVRADLAREDLEGLLTSAGFDPEASVFVLWCGVTMYLDAESVDAVLAWVAARPASSSIAFDYDFAAFIVGDDSFYGAAQIRRWAAGSGEPLTFGLDPGSLPGFLEARGLQLESDLAPAELAGRHLRASDGEIAARPLGVSGLAHTRVAGP
jgi:methyltransferase (TIGR00027 family)